MGGGSLVLGNCSSTTSSKFHLNLNGNLSLSSLRPYQQAYQQHRPCPSISCSARKHHKTSAKSLHKKTLLFLSKRCVNHSLTLTAALADTETNHSHTATAKNDELHSLPKIDKSGRFCSPRAARELALLILYASCLEGSDPVRLFDSRLNAPRELDYEFDKSSLLEYNHMSYGGSSVTTSTEEEAEQLLSEIEKESAIEEAVLSAPPKLVYSKLLLRFTRKLLCAVVDKWDSHVLVIDKITPQNWKIEPSGRILEFSILHLAMSEISVVGTKKQIVINEAVDLAKRFCDGSAPRIINGCLRTFIQDLP